MTAKMGEQEQNGKLSPKFDVGKSKNVKNVCAWLTWRQNHEIDGHAC